MAELFSVPDLPPPETSVWDAERLASKLIETYDHIADLEKDALLLYEPQEIQAMYHACRAPNVILIGGTRAGKTLCGCIEDARCVTNSDPHKKYPKKGTLMLLGYGWNHVGRVFFPMLFLPGAFKIIRDVNTRKWRAYRTWEAEDAARADEAEDAPPLIHPRHYDPKDIAWESKGQNQFVSVKLNTGWQIWAFSSESDPRTAQGFRIQRIHVDEDLSDERWIGELTSRKAQDKGVLHWTAVPHSKNESMLRLVELAEKEQGKADPLCVTYRLPFLANKHIDERAKQIALAEWANEGEDVLRMRSEGEFTYDSVLMYPTFNVGLHGYNRSLLPNGEVPKNWTRFVAIDPGHHVMGAVFGAIPPDNSMVLLYDELYIQQCDAEKFGDKMQEKCADYEFQAFIIDAHGARLRDIGGGYSVWDRYQQALAQRNVRCETSGSSFSAGCDIISKRAEAVRLALRVREKDGAYLRILVNDDPHDPSNSAPAVPHIVRTLKRYRKKQDAKGRVQDEPETRGDVHMAQVVEYLLAYSGLQYVAPKEKPKLDESSAYWMKTREWFKNFGSKSRPAARDFVHLGPSSSLRDSA